MAQWNKNQQDYLNQERTLHEVYIQSDQYGNIINEGATGRGAFGEYAVSELTPVVQLDPIYGLPTNSFQTYSFTSGIATTRNSLFVAETGTSAYGYSVVRSKRFLRYRPGQGGVARFTAHFINPTVGVTLRAGFFSQESALQVGFNTNGKFGILRQYGTKAEIRKLTITTAASSSGISTVILNGTSYNVSLVNDSADTSATAAKLGFSTSYATHIPDQRDNTIIFLANSVGPQTGNFQFIPGTTGAVGTFTTIQSGKVATEEWTYQEDWNLDNLTGVGGTENPSGVTLDTTKLNVFQINYRWLGAGEQRYAIENPINGDMIFVHHAHYSNKYNIPWVDNPSFKIGYAAANLSGVGIASTAAVCGASLMMGVEGKIVQNVYPSSAFRSTAGLSANVVNHLITVQNPTTNNGVLNTREIIMKALTGTFNSGQAPAEIMVFLDAPLATGSHIFKTQPGGNSIALISEEDGTISESTNTPILSYAVASSGSLNIDLSSYRIVVSPGSNISLGIKASSITATNTSLIWEVD
jgi:hypothetical protein